MIPHKGSRLKQSAILDYLGIYSWAGLVLLTFVIVLVDLVHVICHTTVVC
jgi:hypothetical protein